MNIHYTTQFKKDYKRIKKQNKDPDQLKVVIKKLVGGRKFRTKIQRSSAVRQLERSP